jgi:hypothetical protein
LEFKYDGGGLTKGGNVSLFVDGKKDGEGRIDMTVPMLFSADETCDVGKETGSPVLPDYRRNDRSGAGLKSRAAKVGKTKIRPPTADRRLLDERNARRQLVADDRPNLVLDLDVARCLRGRQHAEDLGQR